MPEILPSVIAPTFKLSIYFDVGQYFTALIEKTAITALKIVGNKAKGRISNGCSTPNLPKNEHFLLLDTHIYVSVSMGEKCSFFIKLGVYCFLINSVLRFALCPYY